MLRPTLVLPAPLSPVRARVSPRLSERETSLTALPAPSIVLNWALRPSMRRSGSSKSRPFLGLARPPEAGVYRELYPAGEAGARLGERSDGADHPALHLDVVGVRADGLHRLVGRLETDLGALAVELFQCGLLLPLEPGRHHVPVAGAGGGFHDDDGAVVDRGVDHGVALHTEGVDVLPSAHHVRGDLQRLLRVVAAPGVGGGDGDGLPGGYGTDDRHGDHAGPPSARLQELDGSGDLPVAPDGALLLQDAQG